MALSRTPIQARQRAPAARVLQRKCACGCSNAPHATCRDCKSRVSPGALVIGTSNDPLEHEADRIAAQALAMSDPPPVTAGGQRIQRATARGARHLQPAPASVDQALAGPARPLESALRADMEQRLRYDFSRVRVHADSQAAQSAHDVHALAYTVGPDIVFASGQFAPHTPAGRRLIAHELSHVMQQQGGVVRRTLDPQALKEFDERVKKLKARPAFQKLKGNAPAEVAEILVIIRKRDDALAQLKQLEELFDTPEGAPAAQAAVTLQEIEISSTENVERLKKPKELGHKEDEETISKDKSRVFSKKKGRDGTTFDMDARDVTNIALIVKVNLTAKSKTKENTDAIAKIKTLEDAIEKRIATWGYSLDLQFVDKPGPEVFTINVDTGAWANAGNVAGGDATFAHELHHLLGLEQDRYDYRGHRFNTAMPIDTRIHWFLMEFRKTIKNNPESIMNTNEKSPLDDDVCMVAGKRSQADIDACVKQRSEARNKIIDPAIKTAEAWAKKAGERVASDAYMTTGIEPARIAEGMFESKYSSTVARTRVAAAGAQFTGLTTANIRLVSALVQGCEEDAAITTAATLPLELCPQFFRLNPTHQSRAVLRGAFHLAGIGGAGTDKECASESCKTSCGGKESADTWARFTQCIGQL
jgi:hypothetical protein